MRLDLRGKKTGRKNHPPNDLRNLNREGSMCAQFCAYRDSLRVATRCDADAGNPVNHQHRQQFITLHRNLRKLLILR